MTLSCNIYLLINNDETGIESANVHSWYNVFSKNNLYIISWQVLKFCWLGIQIVWSFPDKSCLGQGLDYLQETSFRNSGILFWSVFFGFVLTN